MKKKVALQNRLSLDRETIARLDEQQLTAVAGGATIQSFSCVGSAAEALDEALYGPQSCCENSCNSGLPNGCN